CFTAPRPVTLSMRPPRIPSVAGPIPAGVITRSDRIRMSNSLIGFPQYSWRKIRSEEARGAWWVEGTGTEPRSRRRPATKSIATGPFRRDGHHFRYRISRIGGHNEGVGGVTNVARVRHRVVHGLTFS